MEKIKYTTTDCFKVGEMVWVSGIKFHLSGRIKYIIKPTKCEITDIGDDYIKISSNAGYYAPRIYYLNIPEKYRRDLEFLMDYHIAKTKEEAIKNYNLSIEEEIERRYKSFRIFERGAMSRLL